MYLYNIFTSCFSSEHPFNVNFINFKFFKFSVNPLTGVKTLISVFLLISIVFKFFNLNF